MRDVEQAGIADRFRMHGHCDWTTMRRMFASAHVVIVPTRTEFVEGFNSVVAEAVIAGKPVITSSVCPALEMVPRRCRGGPAGRCAGLRRRILASQTIWPSTRKSNGPGLAIREIFLDNELTFNNVLRRLLQTTLERR